MALYVRDSGVVHGMRQAELMGLKWQDVNLKDGFLILHETKNGEQAARSIIRFSFITVTRTCQS